MIKNSQNINTGTINSKGDVLLGGKKITNLFKSIEYKEIIENIEELEKDIEDLPKDKQERIIKKRLRLQKLLKTKEAFEKDVIELYYAITRIKISSERLEKAKQYFEEGDFKMVNEVLILSEIIKDKNILFERKEQLLGEKTKLDEQLDILSNELIIKGKAYLLDLTNPERLNLAKDCYEQSVETLPTFDNLYELASFLQAHYYYIEANKYYEQILHRFEKEKEYEKKLIDIKWNLASLYIGNGYSDKSDKYFNELLEFYWEKINEDNSEDIVSDIGLLYRNFTQLKTNKSQYVEARELTKISYNIFRGLTKKNEKWRFQLSMSYHRLANIEGFLNNYETACKIHEQAIKELKRVLEGIYDFETDEIIKLNSETIEKIHWLSLMYSDYGYKFECLKKLNQAIKFHSKALKIQQSLSKSNEQIYLYNVCETLNRIASIEAEKGNTEQAEKVYISAFQMYHKYFLYEPQTGFLNYATLLVDMSMFYTNHIVDRNKSCVCLNVALPLVKSNLNKSTLAKQYYQMTRRVLAFWKLTEKELEEEFKTTTNNA